MSGKAGFTLRGRNPDVLTCIANLSNDEVFTPPEFANRILDTLAASWSASNDGRALWSDPELKFLDPFTKSGVFLREIAARLTKGLEEAIPDLDERVDHILTKQVFGIGVTGLTSMLARRSLYCSKTANGPHSIAKTFDSPEGNIWFERTEHSWVGATDWVITSDESGNSVRRSTNGRCKFCGASQSGFDRGRAFETHAYAPIHTENIKARVAELFGADMQFDVIVGNPPYQLSDGGGTGSSAIPIYNKFVTQAQALEPRLMAMVIPARWYSGGKGLDSFRDSMLKDRRLRFLADYPDSRSVFDGVDIAGGVCYFLWDRDNEGDCLTESVVGDTHTVATRILDEYPTFIRDNRALQIIKSVEHGTTHFMDALVSPRDPFRIAETANEGGDTVFVYASDGDREMPRAAIGRHGTWVDQWKVLLSKTTSEHAGQTDKAGRKRVLSRIEVMKPGTACTGSYLVLGPFESQAEAHNAATYLRTKFVRFLASTVLLTQNITRGSFRFVPQVDFTRVWTDEELLDEFSLSAEQAALIDSTIRDMEHSNG